MIANYYLGQSIGKKRKDGSPFYCCNVLAVDRFGNLTGCPLFFPDVDSYNNVLSMNLAPGTPILVHTTWQGAFVGIEVDKRYKPLNLDELATAPTK